MKDMRRVLDRLSDARWLRSSALTEQKLVLDWTDEGKAGMASLSVLFCELHPLTPEQEECLRYLAGDFYRQPPGMQSAPPSSS
jgi:hypothetical protein